MAYSKMATAIYLAGCAVAHAAAGLQLHELRIRPKVLWRLADCGEVHIPAKIEDSQLPGYLVALMASREAEAEWLVRHRQNTLEAARAAITDAMQDELEAFEEWAPQTGMTEEQAQAQARAIVLQHWPFIEEVAARLARARHARRGLRDRSALAVALPRQRGEHAGTRPPRVHSTATGDAVVAPSEA